MGPTATLLLILLTAAVKSADDFSNRFTPFDWELTKKVEVKAQENVVISPVSVKLVLATLKEGARGNTSSQLASALGLDDDHKSRSLTALFASIIRSLQMPGDGYDLDVGTQLYVDQNVEPATDYAGRIKYLYNATIEKVDFKRAPETVKKINSWVNSVTKGNIQELISDPNSMKDVVMLLLNAIYFKGKWEFPFDKEKTKTGDFWVQPQYPVKAQFMSATNSFHYVESPQIKASILRLPYQGDKFAMYIVLPDKRNGLMEVIKNMTPDKLREAKAAMQEYTVNIKLPKFNFEYTASLADTLQELGVKDMFNGYANFSAMTRNNKNNLFVSNVLQKAGLEVNEIGSIAYAATQADLFNKFGEDVVDFIVDHPFLFFIEDDPTMTVVFAGKVVDPTSHGSPTASIVAPSTSPKPIAVPGPVSVNMTQGGKNEAAGADLSKETEDRYGRPTKHPGTERFSFFDIELLQRVYREVRSNIIISPASVKTTLGLIMEGAEGSSSSQIREVLRLPTNTSQAKMKLHDYQQLIQFIDLNKDGNRRLQRCCWGHNSFHATVVKPVRINKLRAIDDHDPGVILKMGSKILAADHLMLKKRFKETVVDDYFATIHNINFASPQAVAAEINNWVSNITRNFIPQLVEPDSLDPNSLVVVLNAIYFKGNWKSQFDPKDTTKSCFYTSATQCVKTNMMTLTGEFRYAYVNELKSQVLEMPYSDERYSMVFVLPDDRNGLDLVVKDLPFVQLISLLEGLDTTEVAVTIPKFSLEFDLQMVPLLKKVGIIDIFEEKANLKGMFAQDVKAQISAIIHKAKISVNEKGTEAGAGTASHVVPLMIHEAEQFIADHQFLFFITDFHTGFLFAGAFLNPDETKTSNQGGGKVDAEGPLLSFPEMSSSAPTRRPQPMAQPSSSTAKPPRRTGNVGYQGQISSRPYPLPPRHQNTNQKDTINFSG